MPRIRKYKELVLRRKDLPEKKLYTIFETKKNHFMLQFKDKAIGVAKIDGETLKFESVWVKNFDRQKRLGSIVVREMESFARTKGLKRIELFASPKVIGDEAILNFYKNLGFKPTKKAINQFVYGLLGRNYKMYKNL